MIDAMKQALEALETDDWQKKMQAITALRLAIEQAEKQEPCEYCKRGLMAGVCTCKQEKQEPVAWMNDSTPAGVFARHKTGADNFGCTIPLYTAPPQRQPQSTTDMMMDLADRLGELPSDVDPRAWEHLLVYAPRQKKPEPVAMRYDFDGYGYKYIDSGSGSNWQTRHKGAEPLYTTPPQRQPLTLEEADEVIKAYWGEMKGAPLEAHRTYIRSVERKHGIGGGE